MEKQLEKKVALVTGAGSGIGKAIGVALAKNGGIVAITDLRLKAAKEVTGIITEMGLRAEAYKLDVSKKAEVDKVIHELAGKLGKIDILVNNAGISQLTAFEKIPEEEWDRILNTNLKGTFLCSQAAFRIMKNNGGGSIINIASGAARSGGMVSPGLYNSYAHYAASKAAIESLTRSVAFEGAAHGIRVNAVSPGPVDTGLIDKTYPPDKIRQLLASIPSGRLARPEEVAAAVVFLASERSEYITAKVLDVNNALLMD